MAAQDVEAVWVWYFGKSVQKATYGRFDGDKTYSKDYLQVSGDCGKLMGNVFHADELGSRIDLTLKWFGGEAPGFIQHSSDRFHLAWLKGDGPPEAWRLTETPDETKPRTIPGNPDGATPDEADQHLADYQQRGIDAYLVAVKLRNEPDVVHLRAYINDPSAELSFASTSLLPNVIQQILESATPSRACSSIQLNDTGAELTPQVAGLLEKLEENPNLLLVGPPGTGKSVLLDELTNYIENPGSSLTFDPDENHNAWTVQGTDVEPGLTRTIVLHPAYSYENLVLGLLPVPDPSGSVSVEVVSGPLLNLAHFASGQGHRSVLVLDEFNRGNASAILGDTLALLDKDKREKSYIDLPYQSLNIETLPEFAVRGNRSVNQRFTLPKNFYLVAAMNSSDRSVAPLDAALRRRFSIIEMAPDYELLSKHLGADEQPDFDLSIEHWTVPMVSSLAVAILRNLNDRITAVLGRDFCIGHSNFWHVSGETVTERLQSIANAWDRRITQSLKLSLQENDELLGVILSAGQSDKAVDDNESQAAWWKKSPDALGSFGAPRLEFNNLSDMEMNEIHIELKRLANV
ncbi:AAA family ATPase [Glutamicibacter sp.]|uniref:AAA family ATPase n=1 Tax=Glutamicibacter sp. TaxID=1931995 RepID=UPI003D6A2ACE